MSTHKIDAVTRCCIYCNQPLRKLFNHPQECARLMKPIDEPVYGEPLLLHLVKHIQKARGQ